MAWFRAHLQSTSAGHVARESTCAEHCCGSWVGEHGQSAGAGHSWVGAHVQSAFAWHGSERTCKALERVMLRVRAHVQSIVVGQVMGESACAERWRISWVGAQVQSAGVGHGWGRMCRALVWGMGESACAYRWCGAWVGAHEHIAGVGHGWGRMCRALVRGMGESACAERCCMVWLRLESAPAKHSCGSCCA